MCALTRTLRTTLLTAVLAGAGVAWGGVGAAAATINCTLSGVAPLLSDICQRAEASQDNSASPPPQPPSDAIVGDSGTGVIPSDIVAEIPVAGVEPTSVTGFATASVGRFGAIGLSAHDFSGSFTQTIASVEIQNDSVYVNRSGVAQHLFQHLIIDGGSMSVAGTKNAEILFNYRISAVLGTSPLVKPIVFDEIAILATDSLGRASFTVTHDTDPTVNHSSLDLGIIFDPVTKVATIPLSAQTLDLGFLSPGDGVDITFKSSFNLEHDPSSSGLPTAGTLTAHYSDPFHLSANSALGTVAPETGAVPEPSTWAMMLLGFAGLGFAFRQSRRKASFA
jgi:PEP-CTERM motif